MNGLIKTGLKLNANQMLQNNGIILIIYEMILLLTDPASDTITVKCGDWKQHGGCKFIMVYYKRRRVNYLM